MKQNNLIIQWRNEKKFNKISNSKNVNCMKNTIQFQKNNSHDETLFFI